MGTRARLELILDCPEPEHLAEFWTAALDYRVFFSDASVAVLVPKEGTSPPLLLQGVPEAKTVKNRMHLDIVTDEIEPEVRRLEELGAIRQHDAAQSMGPVEWVTMTDPAGNEFCVSTGVEW